MRILLVSTQDYIHHPIPSRHHYIFEYLAQRHEIHVPHFHVSEGPERKTRLKVHEATKYFQKSPALHYALNAYHHYKVMDRIIRDEKIDIVVAGNVLAGTAALKAAKKHNIPVLFDLKDWFPDSAAIYYKNPLMKKMVHSVVYAVTKYNLKHSDRVTTVSPKLQEMVNDMGIECGMIPNGVATDYFKPMDTMIGRNLCGISRDEFVIGFLGSIERRFELDEVIKTLPELIKYNEKTRLLIVGGSLFTDYLDELKALTENLGLSDRVIFTGLIEHTELPKYISAMDVCIIPLKSEEVIECRGARRDYAVAQVDRTALQLKVACLFADDNGRRIEVFCYKSKVMCTLLSHAVDMRHYLYDDNGIALPRNEIKTAGAHLTALRYVVARHYQHAYNCLKESFVRHFD